MGEVPIYGAAMCHFLAEAKWTTVWKMAAGSNIHMKSCEVFAFPLAFPFGKVFKFLKAGEDFR